MSPDEHARSTPVGSGRIRCPSVGEQVDHRIERAAEGGPVIEVEFATELLAQSRAEPRPGAIADALVPPLQVVDAAGDEHRQRRADQHVARRRPCTARPRTPTRRRRPSIARPAASTRPLRQSMITIATSPEPAREREAVAAGHRRELLRLERPLAQELLAVVRARRSRSSMPSARISRGARLPRCW